MSKKAEYVAAGEYRKEAMTLLLMFNLLIRNERYRARLLAMKKFVQYDELESMRPIEKNVDGLMMMAFARRSENGKVPVDGMVFGTIDWIVTLHAAPKSVGGSKIMVSGNPAAFERDMTFRKFTRAT